jgi:hypothetical protein
MNAMKRHLRLSLFLPLWLLMVSAHALPPQRVVIEYDMSYNGTAMAEAVDRIEHDGKTYTLSEEVKGKGLYALVRSGSAKRSVRGTIAGAASAGLRPAEFRDKRGNAEENVARFDWSKGSIAQGQEGKAETRLMSPAAGEVFSDRLSFLWTFAFGSVDALKPGNEVKAQLTDGKGLSSFRYRVAGNETLQTPAGSLNTVKLVKQRDGGDERSTEIWLAIDRQLVPVRILVVEKDGTRIDQIARRISTS